MQLEPAEGLAQRAALFSALGDPTRLAVLAKLCRGEPQSIARLASGLPLSRQAVTKHLHVLEDAHVVRGLRAGRETLYALDPASIDDARRFLDDVSRLWDDALDRLKRHVET